MRRKEREIKDIREIESIILSTRVCRVAFSDGDQPYIVPLCFGYLDNTLYIHAAREGKKIDMIRKNNKVCFEFDTDHDLKKSPDPCKWGLKYRSVIGFGRASLIDEEASKVRAFNTIMQHYLGKSFSTYGEGALRASVIIKITIDSMTGKQSGY
jgi:nitroimidazol reductase NimA-like FMN-containing flavoprotein (pyridoxamine 5'-phosphate oxidase superfamily)